MARLILAPAGGGKTEAVQAELRALKQADPLAEAWVLVSTERQVADFRRRFMEAAPADATMAVFNIAYFNFYSLYWRILALARQAGRLLTQPARLALIGALLRHQADAWPRFAGAAELPGFARAVASLIDELKQCRIEPEAFTAAATSPRERDLAAIYSAYMALLQTHELIDQEGAGWLAVNALHDQPRLAANVALLVVDGYDQLNPLQVALLDALDRRVGTSVITLATAPTERIIQTFTAIATTFSDRLRLNHLDDNGIAAPERFWIEAPTPTEEAAAAMRAIKARLAAGEAPESIVVAVRDWGHYGDALVNAAAAYEVPIAAHYAEAPASNPAVAALLAAIDLPRGGFRRRPVLDALRSPYLRVAGLDEAALALLDSISRAAPVVGGREEWLSAIAAAATPQPADEDAEAMAPIALADGAALAEALAAFFDAVTPPESGDGAVYVAWLERLIGREADEDDADDAGALGLLAQSRAQGGDGQANDRAALARLKDLLRGLLAAERLAQHIGLPLALGRDRFLDWLTGAAGSAPLAGHSPAGHSGRDGRVLVTTASEVRGLPHGHVVVVGLAEGLFPARIPPDALLFDTERARFRARGIALPDSAERADDVGLFASVIGTARRTLTLCRPTFKQGEAWAPSPLWEESRAGVSDADVEARTLRLSIGAVPADPAALAEAAASLVKGLKGGAVPPVGRWLAAAHPDYARHLARAITVERRRHDPAHPHDRYTGALADQALVAHARAETAARTWSASALNDYGLCPFRYFAHRLLGIEPGRDPEEGIDVRQRGTLMHAILERTYKAVQASGDTIGQGDPAALARALAELDSACADLLASAPQALSFRVTPAWAGEQTAIRRRLRALVEADFHGGGPASKLVSGPRRPFGLEVTFGGPEASLRLPGGRALRVRGTIDRLDEDENGRLVVIDYKSGSTAIDTREITSGRNVQMLLYLEVASHLYPERLAGGVFWHIPGNKASGALDVQGETEALAQGRVRVAEHLKRMAQGDFRSRPMRLEDKRCSHHCDFYQLCRPSAIAREKG